MPPRCQVCAHPRLYLIHEKMLEGLPLAAVARMFGVDRNALIRHREKHMPDAMREAAENAAHAAGPTRLQAVEGEVLLGQAAEVYEKALDTLEDLEKPGKDQRARVSALREVRACLEMLAKLNFQIEDRGRGRIDQTGAPEIDAAIVRALEARGVGVDLSAARSEAPHAPLALMPASSDAEEMA
jgi:hypothetical protein